jgi:hypothetical protein
MADSNKSASNIYSKALITGLEFALFFVLGLLLAGYSLPLSLFLGILAAFASGWIVTWWHTEGEIDIEQVRELGKKHDGYSFRKNIRVAKQQRYRAIKMQSRNRRQESPLSWLIAPGSRDPYMPKSAQPTRITPFEAMMAGEPSPQPTNNPGNNPNNPDNNPGRMDDRNRMDTPDRSNHPPQNYPPQGDAQNFQNPPHNNPADNEPRRSDDR